MKRRDELLKNINKIKFSLLTKLSDYLKNRKNITTNEDWSLVAEIQSSEKLKEIRLLLDDIKGNKAERRDILSRVRKALRKTRLK